MDSVSKDDIRAARRADLYGFLLRMHSQDVVREGDSLRLRSDHSVSVKRGYAGYTDFATDETGNAVDLLTRYLDYDLVGAVRALIGSGAAAAPSGQTQRPAPTPAPAPPVFQLPPAAPSYRQLFAYLTQTRCIPAPVVQKLIDERIVYQEAQHNNIIFVSPQRDFAEVRGTNSFAAPFRGILPGSNVRTGFWWFKTGALSSHAEDVYICESAIDAISLYTLHRYQRAARIAAVDHPSPDSLTGYSSREHQDAAREQAQRASQSESNLYVSISGVGNVHKCVYIRQHMPHSRIFLCFDSDDAGETAARKLIADTAVRDGHIVSPRFIQLHVDLSYKDYNEQLQHDRSYYDSLPGLRLDITT